MYTSLWRMLPGSAVTRVILLVLLAVWAFFLLMVMIFPAVDKVVGPADSGTTVGVVGGVSPALDDAQHRLPGQPRPLNEVTV